MKRLLSALGVFCICCVALVVSAANADAAPPKVCLCHNGHTICVGPAAVRAHQAHGDAIGECRIACGGSAGTTCPIGQFCERDLGVCAADSAGLCAVVPVTCPTTVALVCGCDGTTYDNECLANQAGVSVLHTGECDGGGSGGACGGASGATCGAGEFCKRADGSCDADAEGTCTGIPASCPAELNPVCGCDNITYSNACFADAAGVAVDTAGACVPGAACGGVDGASCATGEFCRPATGDCAVDAAGTCEPLPPVCSDASSPVCGCDGITYDNACLAEVAGVGVDHSGACDQAACGGAGGATCASGTFCSRPEGACETTDAGVCSPLPADCPAVNDPACGCNGVTYSNECIADAAGVTVAHEGPCTPALACGGPAGILCDAGEFCRAATGSCGTDAEGLCTALPTDCPVAESPVCGCDGLTYFNVCFADAAGVTVAGAGACVAAN